MGTAQEPCDTKCKYVMSCEWLNNLKVEDRNHRKISCMPFSGKLKNIQIFHSRMLDLCILHDPQLGQY